MSNFKCPMCTDCPDNCPLDSDTDTREHSADYYKGAREFEEWLKTHCNSDGYIGRGRFDELLAVWQKGEENNA